METQLKNKLIKTKTDTRDCILKMCNLDKPGILEEAVNILNVWVKQQPHFNKKDFSYIYLRNSILLGKGSIERAKSRIDKMCTMRTLMPHLFGIYNCKTDFEHLYEVIHSVGLPNLTDEHYRIHIVKYFDVDWEPSQILHYFRHHIIFAELLRIHDFTSGFILILDFSEANLMSYLKKLNPVLARQAMTAFVEGYGLIIKAIYIITKSKFIDGLITLLKQVMSAKIAGRIKVLKCAEDLHEFIPKNILPKDYGGDERSLKTLLGEWMDLLSSKEHLDYLEEISKATTNESFRPKNQFLENYGGLPGTFRFLSVD